MANITNNRFNHVYHAINATRKTINSALTALHDTQHRMDQIYSMFNQIFKMHVLHSHNYIFSYRIEFLQSSLSELKTYRDCLTKLMNGILTPTLVPIDQLKEGILKLSGKLTYGVKPLTEDRFLALYYKRHIANAVVMGNALLITIPVPLVNVFHHFLFYKVRSYGLIHHSRDGNSQSGYTKIQDLPSYLAVRSDRKTFVELSEDDYRDCKDSWPLCGALSVSMETHAMTCLMGIFLQEDSVIKNQCRFKVFLKDTLKPHIRKITDSEYLFVNMPGRLRMLCEDQVQFVSISNVFSTITM